MPVASTSTVLRGCTQVNQQAARTKAVHTASVGIEKMRRFGGRIKHWRSPKDIKSRNKSLGSAESGGRTAAADLKWEPVLTTTRARRSRRSDRTETWRAPSRPSARSGNASNQPIGPDGRTGVSSSNSVLPTKSQVHLWHLATLPGGLLELKDALVQSRRVLGCISSRHCKDHPRRLQGPRAA